MKALPSAKSESGGAKTIEGKGDRARTIAGGEKVKPRRAKANAGGEKMNAVDPKRSKVLKKSKGVERTNHGATAAAQYMGADHGGGHVQWPSSSCTVRMS